MLGDRGRSGVLVEFQRRTSYTDGFGPHGVHVSSVIAVPGDVRPSVVRPRSDQIHLVVCTRTMLRFVQQTSGAKRQSLRIPMSVRIDVAADTCDGRVICRNGTIEV